MTKQKRQALLSDERVTLQRAREWVREFRRERAWDNDLNAKNKAISLVVEAVELLEHFQWLSSREVLTDPKRKQEVAEELADVFYWVLTLADNLDIELGQTLRAKLTKAAGKYPAESFSKDSARKNLEKYYELKDKARRQGL